jgi:hypothetical protein
MTDLLLLPLLLLPFYVLIVGFDSCEPYLVLEGFLQCSFRFWELRTFPYVHIRIWALATYLTTAPQHPHPAH